METVQRMVERARQLGDRVRREATPRVMKGAAIAAVVTLFVGVMAFAAGSQSRDEEVETATNATETAEGRVAARERRIDDLADERDSAIERLADERDNHREAISEMEAAAEQRETDLVAREQAVTAVEQAAARREFVGGVVIVGEQVEPGTYRTGELSSALCYYAWMSSTSVDANIVDNNIVEDGTATATLSAGQIFESSGCGTWTKIS